MTDERLGRLAGAFFVAGRRAGGGVESSVPRERGVAAVAQLAERVICNLEVAGSIPAGGFGWWGVEALGSTVGDGAVGVGAAAAGEVSRALMGDHRHK